MTGLQPLRHFQRIALPAYHSAFFYSITADRCCRRDAPQNPHGRPDTLCRSAPPPDQWQKCRLRADLLPGPAAVRRLLPHAVLPGGGPVLPAAEAVPRPGRRPSAPLPAAGSERAGYAASRHPPDDGRRRAGLARRPGLPPLRSSTRSMSRVSTGPWPFFIKGSQHNQHSPLQWRRSAARGHYLSSSGQMSFLRR